MRTIAEPHTTRGNTSSRSTVTDTSQFNMEGRGAEGQQVQCASGERGELCGVIKESTDSIPIGAPMYLNPFFVEEMMGYPAGWTA